jgi:hypothetical protein
MAFGPAAPAGAYRCQNHPDRQGLGICVRCRRVLCAECATKIDRMNFCTTCLAAIGPAPAAAAGGEVRAANPLLGGFLLVVSTLGLAGLFALFGLLLATFRPEP